MLRSAGAVAAGFVFIAALSFATDALLRALVPGAFNAHGGVDTTAMLFAMQGYVAVFAITGCYLAARLAASRPMAHALVLGGLGFAFNAFAASAMGDAVPLWYKVLSLLLVMPYAWIGGRIRVAQLESQGLVARP